MIARQSKQLENIQILRVITIFLMVMTHSYAIYVGGWEMPPSCSDNRINWWIGKSVFCCMLEMFVFISGYICAYQLIVLKRNQTLSEIIKSKAKRLLLPSLFFSLLYLCIFSFESIKTNSFFYNVYSVINGKGHLWFLPMLFWCFILLPISMRIFNKIKMNDKLQLSIVLLIAILPLAVIPFRIGSAFNYFYFFFLGYMVFKHQNSVMNFFHRNKVILLAGLLFLITFISGTLFIEKINAMTLEQIYQKVYYKSIINIIRIIYSTLGVMVIYSIINNLKKINGNYLLRFGKYCFGVYILHQFIIIIIYYNTNLPVIFNDYFLPIITCLVAIIIALVLTFLFLKTKIGNFLIR